MNRFVAIIVAIASPAAVPAWGQTAPLPEDAGDALCRVQTVRAPPGELGPLIEAYNALYRADAELPDGLQRPFILRHSQGDHWDLMLVFPIVSNTHLEAVNTDSGLLTPTTRKIESCVYKKPPLPRRTGRL